MSLSAMAICGALSKRTSICSSISGVVSPQMVTGSWAVRDPGLKVSVRVPKPT